ncbi:MAG: hypothetical protein ACOCQM_02330 [Natronomonas sp.]
MTEGFQTTLESELEARFRADSEVAEAAAAKAAAFREEHEESLTADSFLEAVEAADDYDTFAHRYDLAIGELAANNDDCTDSRAYRLSGFDDLAADAEMGA